MRYNLEKQYEDASDYLKEMAEDGKVVEIKPVRRQRSLKANNYLHLLLQICSNEWGYSLPEMKIIFKRDIAPSVYVYFKNDMAFVKSSAELDTKQTSDSIELLKKYAAEQELMLPEATDEEKLSYYESQIERNQFI